MLRNLFTALLGVLLSIILGFVAYYAYSKFTIDTHEVDWSGVSGMMDTLMVILTVLLLIGLRQGAQSIDQANHSRDADLLNWAMGEMDELKESIKIVTDAHKREPYCTNVQDLSEDYVSNWNDEELKAANRVSIGLQRIGYYASQNLVSKKHYLNLWGPSYLSCWYSLESWVKHKRLKLEEPLDIEDGAYSRRYFEYFAEYCEMELPDLLYDNTRKQFKLPPLPRVKGVRRYLKRLALRFKSQNLT
jgi:hypothetical protein